MTRIHPMIMNLSRFGSTPEMRLPEGKFNSYAGPSPQEQAIGSDIQEIRSGQIMVPSDLVKLIDLDRQLKSERERAKEDHIISKEVYGTLSTSAAAAAAALKLIDDPNHPSHELDMDPRQGYVERRTECDGGGVEATFFRYHLETGVPYILSETDTYGNNTTEFRWGQDGNLIGANIKRISPRDCGVGEESQSFDFSRDNLENCFIVGTSTISSGNGY